MMDDVHTFDAARIPPGRGRAWVRGFTLIELLVATAVFMLLVVVLASMANQTAAMWRRNENKSTVREAARAALSRMEGEMRQAVMPLVKTNPASLQFVVNPGTVSSSFNNRDAVFWQAPIATSSNGADLAIVGYFVRRDGTSSTLCRLLVNPDDPDYSRSATWLSDALLNSKAPGTAASGYQGLFLENVLGMWVTAYSANNTPMSDYDSRVEHQLPARVEVSLALLDPTGAKRIADGGASLPNLGSATNAASFLSGLTNNPALLDHVFPVTISINLPH